MLDAGARKPKSVQVVVNSGENGEVRLNGTVLGVDRHSDLALVRVSGDAQSWPARLPVEVNMTGLIELQPVYIFGFPLGASLGKEISVSDARITSFRKNSDGSLRQIQLNGSMNPGNSGGPIVDSRGVVIGVSVSIIRGAAINFAVPSEKIHGMMHGRVLDLTMRQRYRDQQAVKLPVKVAFLDPLEHIREVKLNYWTGQTGVPRPASPKPPAPQAGDGPVQSVAMQYKEGIAQQDLIMPELPAGRVVWLQTEFVEQDGKRHWGPARSSSRGPRPSWTGFPPT